VSPSPPEDVGDAVRPPASVSLDHDGYKRMRASRSRRRRSGDLLVCVVLEYAIKPRRTSLLVSHQRVNVASLRA
jgi:hypothetical protein